jgi:hypothetical protein
MATSRFATGTSRRRLSKGFFWTSTMRRSAGGIEITSRILEAAAAWQNRLLMARRDGFNPPGRQLSIG